DAAGLAIATRMRAKENGLGVASRNTQDGISLIRTADSALNSVSNILLRMRDLAVQSANGTNSGDDRTATNKEFGQLKEQIDYIAKNTAFNGKTLLDGSASSKVSIKTYDDGGADDIEIKLTNVQQTALTGDSKTLKAIDVTSDANAKDAIKAIDGMVNSIASSRAELGATLNRLDFNVANLNSQASSMASSASQIEDAD
ncbi:flagellin N-terminal helical domain-containing protein, partial [Bacillus cereus]